MVVERKKVYLCAGDTNARSSSSSTTTGEEELGSFFFLIVFFIGLCSYRCSEDEGLILCFCLWDANVTSSDWGALKLVASEKRRED